MDYFHAIQLNEIPIVVDSLEASYRRYSHFKIKKKNNQLSEFS